VVDADGAMGMAPKQEPQVLTISFASEVKGWQERSMRPNPINRMGSAGKRPSSSGAGAGSGGGNAWARRKKAKLESGAQREGERQQDRLLNKLALRVRFVALMRFVYGCLQWLRCH
jgi:hypothetical protein